MLLALVDDQRTPPSHGLKGSCPACGTAMIAKCGTQRIHHWAHRGERVCDPWWEETEWHRAWKGEFPADWQEFIQHDHLGEKHIADVRTPRGVTIEFQHSPLKPEERLAREKFYGNMVWVVDGARLKNDLPRFLNHTVSFRVLSRGVRITSFPEEAFPCNWVNSMVPVFFDFQNTTVVSEEAKRLTRSLVCLLPGRALGQAVVLEISREEFMRSIHDTGHPIPAPDIIKKVEHLLLMQQQLQAVRLRTAELAARHQRQAWRQHGFRRRYARF